MSSENEASTVLNIVSGFQGRIAELERTTAESDERAERAETALGEERACVDLALSPHFFVIKSVVFFSKEMGFIEARLQGFAPLFVRRESVTSLQLRGGFGGLNGGDELEAQGMSDEEAWEIGVGGLSYLAYMSSDEIAALRAWLAAPFVQKGKK